MQDHRFIAVGHTPGGARAVVCPEHARHLCAGHFPDEPIVPGAQLAGLMADVAAWLVGARASLEEVVRCVFLARVHPRDEIVVTARVRTATEVRAAVHAGGTCAARATLRFHAPV